jgi:hypothetical protein
VPSVFLVFLLVREALEYRPEVPPRAEELHFLLDLKIF